MNTNFLKTLAVVFATVLFVSCDKDYNTLGSDVLGGNNIDIEGTPYEIKVYNKEVGVVQSNNLSVNQLGILNNEAFGTTTANVVTQLELATIAPVFKSDIVVDSVVLSLPYYSTKLRTESSGKGIYRLDSIYSNTPKTTNNENRIYNPIKLEIYRNGFTLNDFDPSDPSKLAKYYSNQDNDVDLSKSDLLYSNNSFKPDPSEIKVYQRNQYAPFAIEDIVRKAPGLRIPLNKSYFITNIIQTSSTNLINNNNFKDYFKGLYFKTENISGDGTLMSLDFSKGDITIYYHQDELVSNTQGVSEIKNTMKTLVLNMKGNIVNLLNNSAINADYTNAVTNTNIANGQQQLFLKGGAGSKTYIELFTAAELAQLKSLNPLINDATISFRVDESYLNSKSSLTSGSYSYHPKRLYLYDADNDRVLYDYTLDATTNTTNFKLNKATFGGILEKDSSGNLVYKIKITEHISRIIRDKNDTYKNVRLGLVVTENINLPTYGTLGTSFFMPYTNPLTTSKEIKTYPLGAILNPLGTVLFGNVPATDVVNYDKRVTFKINYTKPN